MTSSSREQTAFRPSGHEWFTAPKSGLRDKIQRRILQGAWREDAIAIDPAQGTATSRVRFTVSDFDPQNVVEAGLDAFRVTRVVCDDPQPECIADLAAPFGVLDLGDVNAFVAGFINQSPVSDLATPFGVFDLADINAFVNAFAAGCP